MAIAQLAYQPSATKAQQQHGAIQQPPRSVQQPAATTHHAAIRASALDLTALLLVSLTVYGSAYAWPRTSQRPAYWGELLANTDLINSKRESVRISN